MSSVNSSASSSHVIPNKFDVIPSDCLYKIATFLPVTDTVRFASVLKSRFTIFPGSIAQKSRELALQFFLECRFGTERALLIAIEKDKLEVASELFLRRPNISAQVGIQAIQNIRRKNMKMLRHYETVLAKLPQYQLFMHTPFLRTAEDVTKFVVPLLRLPIADDWLGQTLIQISETPLINSAANKSVIALLLEKQGISMDAVGQSFVQIAGLASRPSNEEILMSFFEKRAVRSLSFHHRSVGIILAARQGYRRVVAILANSFEYTGSPCSLAVTNAAMFGHREIVIDLLAYRVQSRLPPFDHRIIGQAATEAAEGGHIGIVRALLESTDDLPPLEIDRTLAAARKNNHFGIVQLVENYRQAHGQ